MSPPNYFSVKMFSFFPLFLLWHLASVQSGGYFVLFFSVQSCCLFREQRARATSPHCVCSSRWLCLLGTWQSSIKGVLIVPPEYKSTVQARLSTTSDACAMGGNVRIEYEVWLLKCKISRQSCRFEPPFVFRFRAFILGSSQDWWSSLIAPRK